MKNFFCFVLIIGVLILSGCEIPLDGIDNAQTGADSVKTTGESQNSDTEEKDKVGDNTKDITKYGDPVSLQDTDNKINEIAPVEKMSVTVCYRDTEGSLIPVTRKIDRQEGIAKAAINTMIDNEENRQALKAFDLYPVLPGETTVLGINIKGDLAVIDFNNGILEYKSELEERNIIAGVVYSLTEFKTINRVKILINGFEKEKLKFSADISGTLSRENVLINSSKLNLKNKISKLDVYLFKYINDKYDYILPVSMEYIGVSDDKLPHEVVRLISKKSENEGLFTQIPEKVELLDCSIKDKTLILNFNKEIKNYGGTAREAGLLKQILYSMKQIEGIDRARILIEGKKDDLPEGTDISKDLLLPVEINRF